ncbi:unnamed protein product [Prorocentrum cordatum]|uniref:Reverse transcriptase domain-containing protein n=1 Tax=Prorocentrum cordatum TaxID=2364126 RepID=A0ABN9SLE2_9DINO|nr:unnamed protein product [Polarella glacialis]
MASGDGGQAFANVLASLDTPVPQAGTPQAVGGPATPIGSGGGKRRGGDHTEYTDVATLMEQQTRMMEQMAITNQELQRQAQQQQQQNQQLMGLLARLSPPGLALGEQQPAVAPQAPQVEVEYLKKIPDHIQKQLTHFMQDFEKSMAKITRTRVTIEKLSNDVQVLKVAGSKDTFVQEGTKIMQSVTDDRGASLGLDSTRSKPFDPKFVETKLDSMWHQMVDKEAGIQITGLADTDRRGNVYPLIRLAFAWLESSDYVPIKNDKETGYTLVRRSDNTQIDEMILNGPQYQEVSTDPINFDSVARSYVKLAQDIEKYEDFPIASDITRSLKAPRHTYKAHLFKTCKTHKAPEPISFRNVHAAGKYAFAGLSHWLGRRLREVIKRYPHVVRDSADAARKLMSTRLDPRDHLCTMDVKEFFMSGTTEELVNDILHFFSGRLRVLIERALYLLLDNQFITASTLPGRCFKVVLGTGMGLPHSGDVADLALIRRMETWAVANLTRFSIKQYLRFKDDIFLIWKHSSLGGQFCSELMTKSGFFRLKEIGAAVHAARAPGSLVQDPDAGGCAGGPAPPAAVGQQVGQAHTAGAAAPPLPPPAAPPQTHQGPLPPQVPGPLQAALPQQPLAPLQAPPAWGAGGGAPARAPAPAPAPAAAAGVPPAATQGPMGQPMGAFGGYPQPLGHAAGAANPHHVPNAYAGMGVPPATPGFVGPCIHPMAFDPSAPVGYHPGMFAGFPPQTPPPAHHHHAPFAHAPAPPPSQPAPPAQAVEPRSFLRSEGSMPPPVGGGPAAAWSALPARAHGGVIPGEAPAAVEQRRAAVSFRSTHMARPLMSETPLSQMAADGAEPRLRVVGCRIEGEGARGSVRVGSPRACFPPQLKQQVHRVQPAAKTGLSRMSLRSEAPPTLESAVGAWASLGIPGMLLLPRHEGFPSILAGTVGPGSLDSMVLSILDMSGCSGPPPPSSQPHASGEVDELRRRRGPGMPSGASAAAVEQWRSALAGVPLGLEASEAAIRALSRERLAGAAADGAGAGDAGEGLAAPAAAPAVETEPAPGSGDNAGHWTRDCRPRRPALGNHALQTLPREAEDALELRGRAATLALCRWVLDAPAMSMP